MVRIRCPAELLALETSASGAQRTWLDLLGSTKSRMHAYRTYAGYVGNEVNDPSGPLRSSHPRPLSALNGRWTAEAFTIEPGGSIMSALPAAATVGADIPGRQRRHRTAIPSGYRKMLKALYRMARADLAGWLTRH